MMSIDNFFDTVEPNSRQNPISRLIFDAKTCGSPRTPELQDKRLQEILSSKKHTVVLNSNPPEQHKRPVNVGLFKSPQMTKRAVTTSSMSAYDRDLPQEPELTFNLEASIGYRLIYTGSLLVFNV